MRTSSLFPQFEQLKDVEALCVVFFDLVDSSLLKRKLGPVEGVAVAMRHNNLCTQAVEWYGGQVVKYIGDAVMAVFKTPLAGILAALEVKHVIITQGYRFQTKIGISHGIVTPVLTTGTDYLGYTVDLGARLGSLAAPNQVVTDEVTFSLLKPVLKSLNQVIFRFLGVRELKGVGKIPLVEFTHTDLGFTENAPATKRDFPRNRGAGQELPKLAGLYRQGKATGGSFAALLERITPRDADLEAVSAGFQSVRHVLTEMYDLPVCEVVVSGSLARGTMIRPVGDVDLLVLLAETSFEPGKVLEALGRVVNKAGLSTDLQVDHRAAGFRFQNLRFKLIPGLIRKVDGQARLQMAGEDGTWVDRNPVAPENWMLRAMERNGADFLALLRVLHVWRRNNCPVLRSLHLEMLTDFILGKVPLTVGPEGLYNWFRYLHQIISTHREPFIAEPGDGSGYVDSYLFNSRPLFNRFGRIVTTSLTMAGQALNFELKKQPAQARNQWRVLLGPEFES